MATTQEISVTSIDYARSLVTWVLGNPTGLPVTMAFSMAPPAPALNLYVAAEWESLTAPYMVISLVGIGTLSVLAPGFYYKWVRVANSPQFAAFPAGILRITA